MKQEKSDIWEEEKKKYFANKFSQLLEEWKKKEQSEGRKGTQEEFAKRIYAHINSISRYKKGTDFPSPSALEAICQEFGVTEEIFYPVFGFQRGGDKSFHDETNEQLRQYCDSIGLNEKFVAFITSAEQVRNCFPLHRDNNPVIKTDSPFQVTDKNGNTLFLDSSDLDYLRQLQEEMESFIRFKFYEERQSLRKKQIEYQIEIYTSHTDVTREEILSHCKFKELLVSSQETVYKEDENAIRKAISEIQKERGERIVWHWKKSEIEQMFSSDVDTLIHKTNSYSGYTEDELKAYYADCDKAEEEQKQKFIEAIIKKGDVIDNG